MHILERRRMEIIDWLVHESGSVRAKAAGARGAVRPVAPILRFSGEEEAVRIANDTEFGLSSAVFSRDLDKAQRVAKGLQVGMTHINDWPVNDEANTAFGGEKASGLGRFGGELAIDELTTDHWISVQEIPRRYPI